MEGTAARQTREKAVNPAVTEKAAPGPASPGARTMFDSDVMPRSIGYGMPCAKCRAYYPADMQACPICKSRERVAPTAVPPLPTTAATPQAVEATLLAEERERLRELKSQIYASHPQVAAATFRCALDQNHNGATEPAAVCHSCYGELRQQADHMEAALHMDVKEAGKIVYEAVWADTSDPNKTYINAAEALLTELRKRAEIGGASTH
jgi:hypothetical protein